MPYEFREHTADVAFEAYGKTLGELFCAAADATVNTMVASLGTIRSKVEKVLHLEDDELELLLFDFLGELIFLKDAQGLLVRPLFLSVERGAKRFVLDALVAGETIDPERHEQLIDVKAVTLHQFEVGQTEAGWRCHVILDV